MKKSNLLRAGAVLVSLSFVGVACGGSDDAASDTTVAASTEVTCDAPVASIALQFPETGDAANLGAPMLQGAQLAVDQFNAANPDACVTLKTFDTQGDPAKAPAVAQAIIGDATILGLVGPGFSGESKAALPLFNEAGLATITGSATNAELQKSGFKVFHRILANDALQGPSIAYYVQGALKPTSVGVIDDASDYGKGLADAVKKVLGAAVKASDSIDPKASDFSAVVSKMKDANPDVIRALKEMGVVIRHDSYNHSYPHCWRCAEPLVYRAVSSWFVQVTAFRDRMVELNENISWVPEHIKDGTFGKWIANARDWAISRNRFWGSPIPVWKSDDPTYPRIDVYGSIEDLSRDFGVAVTDLHRPGIDNLVRPNPDDPTGQSMMRRVPEVLDCWFESGR